MIAEQLRKSILQAAIQGKLTEQLPEDGDARDLLKKIQEEKHRLTREGKIKKEKPLPEITEDEIPFDVPTNWCWVRLDQICVKITDGSHNPPPDSGRGVQMISAKNLKNSSIDLSQSKRFVTIEQYLMEDRRTEIRKGDILLSIVGTIGETAIVNENIDLVAQRSVCVLRSLAFNKYIDVCLKSSLFTTFSSINQAGTAQKGLYLNSIKKLVLPLPPLSEQHRIVERLEEVLPVIDKLAGDETKLDELLESFPKKMKDALLQAAIQGKLTEQLPEDGDARDLLKKIQEEKHRLTREGKIKKEKPLPEITEDEIPFDVPTNWCWVRLNSIINTISSREYQILQKDIFKEGSFPVVSQSLSFIEGYSDREDKVLHNPGELLIFGDHSKTIKYITFDFIIGADGTKILHPVVVYGKYLYLAIQWLLINIRTQNYGRHFKLVKDQLIPLPPLSEQHRMVERLEKVIPLLSSINTEIN